MITVENVIHRFRQWADAHSQIKVFTHGQEPDKDLDKGSSYPLMHAVLLDVNPTAVNTGSIVYNFQVSFLDKPTIEEDKNEQSLYALNDCVMYALDLIATIKNETADPPIFGDEFVLSGWGVQALQEVNSHVLWGATLNLQLEVDFTHNYCDVPIAPISGGFDPCTLCGLIGNATALEIINCLSNEQQDAIVEELCDGCVCDPATYRNSDNSFNQEIAAGATFTADDITVTDVDGSTRSVPSNLGVVCEWQNLRIFNSVGTIISPVITSYPTGGQIIYPDFQIQEQGVQFGLTPAGNRINILNADIEDVVAVGETNQITLSLIDINNSDGVTLLSPPDLRGDKTLPDIPFTAIGEDDTIAAPTGIVIDGEIDNFSLDVLTGVLTITPAGGGVTPAGIAYPQISPFTSLIDATAAGNDSVALYKDGRYTGYKPTNPATIASLDPTDESGTTLLENNIFGNKFTYTDLGGNPSSVGTVNPEDRVDWLGHDFGSLPRIVINHEHGYMVTVDRLQNGDKVNMSTDATLGDTWYNWLSFIASLELSGYDNWLPIIGIVSSPWARQVNQGETIYRKFFNNTERADNRINFITGESINATLPFFFNDHGALPILTAIATIPKAGGTGFLGGLSKFIAMRMLTEADITALTA